MIFLAKHLECLPGIHWWCLTNAEVLVHMNKVVDPNPGISPPLYSHGNVRQTDNGLLLDGKSGWLSADGLQGKVFF